MPTKTRISRLARLMLALMALPLIGGWYFSLWSRLELAESPANPRNVSRPEFRGALRDRAGRLLAYPKGRRRVYPRGAAFASFLGYFDVRLGSSAVEAYFDQQLQGRQRPGDLVDGAGVAPLQRVMGPDVVLTIDSQLQELSYQLLQGSRGSVTLLHVPTGDVLAAASSPSYDPSRLGDAWDDLRKDPREPLFHRGLAGLYSPGSTFKVLTMLAALEEKVSSPGSILYCSGGLPMGDFTMTDSSGGGHGALSLEDALVHSCNVIYGGLGLKLGVPKIEKWMDRTKLLLASDTLPGMFPGLAPSKDRSEVVTAQTAIGQGQFLVTPAAMARLAALVARRGLDIPPRVYRAEQRGSRYFLSPPAPARRLVSAESAEAVAKAMRGVVERGTGGAAQIPGLTVAGKTGTAENPRGEPDAWFIAFCPADKPMFAICVMLENRGYGGTYAAPIAAKVLKAAMNSPIAKVGRPIEAKGSKKAKTPTKPGPKSTPKRSSEREAK